MVLLDRFSGSNPEEWVFRAEWYFTYLGFSQKDWVPLPSFYFDGEALIWFDELFNNKQLAGWDHFVDKSLIRLRSRTRDTNRTFLPIPKQHEAVKYYQAAFPLCGNITNSSSPQYLNEHSDRNNPSLAHTVFKEMSDRKTNRFRDVETMVLPQTQVCHLVEQGSISISLEIQYDLFGEISKADHMFDKMPERFNDVDFLDSTSVGSNAETSEDMENRSSLMISSVLSVYDQMVTGPNLSNSTTNDEAISFPNKVLSELLQYGNGQSNREGEQNVRTISYETPPPQESTSLLLSAFGMHNDHSLNAFFLREVVDDAKLVEAITAAKYWKVVVVGGEYIDCELLDDLGLFAIDEETVKHFRISTTRMFDNSLQWSCVIDCGHKVARLLIGDPNFSWTVEFVLKDVDEEVDKAFPSFSNIYLLVDDISTSGSTIGWNARIALLEAGMIVYSVHRHQPQHSKLVQN